MNVRKRKDYWIDSEFISGGYAARLGPAAVAVYNALCYHSSPTTLSILANDTGLSEDQVKQCLEQLEAYRIVVQGVLLDVSLWKRI